MVPTGSRVADIGTDHGALAVQLLRSGRAVHCIATDTREAVRTEARRSRWDAEFETDLEVRIGDGLDVLEPTDRIDVLVIAGLGCGAICRILSHPVLEPLGVRRVIVQPQTEAPRLRRWLVRRRLRIVDETLVRDRWRFYFVIAAEPGHPVAIDPHPDLDEEELLEAGPCLVRTGGVDVIAYWTRQLERNRRILTRASPGPGRQRAEKTVHLATRVLQMVDRDATRGGPCA